MTSVVFIEKNLKLCGFTVMGHSTENESDIEGKTVCAAVSSAAYMAANTISEIIGDSIKVEIDDAKMHLTVDDPSKETEAILKGFRLHMTELGKQYSKRIKIITEV